MVPTPGGVSMLIEAMEAIAEKIKAATERPVTCDPASTTVTPCVLVEVPELDFTTARTMCAQTNARFPVLISGPGNTYAALPALDKLLSEVLHADLDITTAGPVASQPVNTLATADPVIAYRLYVEEMIA